MERDWVTTLEGFGGPMQTVIIEKYVEEGDQRLDPTDNSARERWHGNYHLNHCIRFDVLPHTRWKRQFKCRASTPTSLGKHGLERGTLGIQVCYAYSYSFDCTFKNVSLTNSLCAKMRGMRGCSIVSKLAALFCNSSSCSKKDFTWSCKEATVSER